jgi:phage baseplate assembly protein W
MDTTGLAFPFKINAVGQVATTSGDANIHAKIVQVVLTAPGERVNLPTFGCGLRDLVFDPANDILAATTEYTITRALQEWVGDDILVDRVDVSASDDGTLMVEVTYVRRNQLEPGKVRIMF